MVRGPTSEAASSATVSVAAGSVKARGTAVVCGSEGFVDGGREQGYAVPDPRRRRAAAAGALVSEIAMTRPSLVDLKEAYARNQNITGMLRAAGGRGNEQSAILIAYDLQAGSYVRALDDPARRASLERYVGAIAEVLRPLEPAGLLEAGVGEATTLRGVLERLAGPSPVPAIGFDISWSRTHVARNYLADTGVAAGLYVGELEHIALPSDSVDVVFTAHAVEPNHGREAEVLRELYRVTGRYLVLFEPAYEFASPEARARMEAHGYCRGLGRIARENGWEVIRHELLGVSTEPLNPTAVLLVRKSDRPVAWGPPGFACPSCGAILRRGDEAWFCASEGLAYPVLRGLPCLARHHAVLASRFMD